MFSPSVIKALGYYVYVYSDPETGDVFYVGKGKGNQAFSHLKKASEGTPLIRKLEELRKRGLEPTVEILLHGLSREVTEQDRLSVAQVRARYEPERAQIVDPTLLIRIQRLFRHDLDVQALYDATRGAWRIGKRRENAQVALSVFDGIVQEVYQICSWFPAGSTLNSRTPKPAWEERWEFVGNIAKEPIRSRYLHKSVQHHFPKGTQSPFVYVNVPTSSTAE